MTFVRMSRWKSIYMENDIHMYKIWYGDEALEANHIPETLLIEDVDLSVLCIDPGHYLLRIQVT